MVFPWQLGGAVEQQNKQTKKKPIAHHVSFGNLHPSMARELNRGHPDNNWSASTGNHWWSQLDASGTGALQAQKCGFH